MLDLIEVRRPHESARAINACCATTPCTIWLSPYFTVLWHGSNNSRFWVPLYFDWEQEHDWKETRKDGGLFNSQQGRKTTSLISNVPLPATGCIHLYEDTPTAVVYMGYFVGGQGRIKSTDVVIKWTLVIVPFSKIHLSKKASFLQGMLVTIIRFNGKNYLNVELLFFLRLMKL